MFKRKKSSEPQFYATVADGLKKIYRGKLLPLEEAYDFHDFVSPALNEPDFDAKPMVSNVQLNHQLLNLHTAFIWYSIVTMNLRGGEAGVIPRWPNNKHKKRNTEHWKLEIEQPNNVEKASYRASTKTSVDSCWPPLHQILQIGPDMQNVTSAMSMLV